MGDATKIEWADATLNFWLGCTQLKRRQGGSACDYCYAMTLAKRFKIAWNAPPKKTAAGSWAKPAQYQRGAARFLAKNDRRRRVFVNSMSDFFDKLADQAWRDQACDDMEAAPDVIFMLLTKRPENVLKMVPKRWLAPGGWPENVWIGVTVEAQDTADHRVPLLGRIPARIRFLSMEPLLEDVSLRAEWLEWISWVIIGGESGSKARPTHIKWVRRVLAACEAFAVPVLFKQWGEWAPFGQWARGEGQDVRKPAPRMVELDGVRLVRVGKAVAGRKVDGELYSQFPNERAAA